MKSVGGLFAKITDAATLELALHRAAKGKRHRPSVQRFLADGVRELERLRAELSSETYQPLPYDQFRVRDPKPRLISRADFRDRVVHHAICAELGPVIERRLIHISGATTTASTMRRCRNCSAACCGKRRCGGCCRPSSGTRSPGSRRAVVCRLGT